MDPQLLVNEHVWSCQLPFRGCETCKQAFAPKKEGVSAATLHSRLRLRRVERAAAVDAADADALAVVARGDGLARRRARVAHDAAAASAVVAPPDEGPRGVAQHAGGRVAASEGGRGAA